MARKLISIVTPCYNEQLNIEDCYRAVREVMERDLPAYDYEHVFCDNASTDESPQVLAKVAAQDVRVKVIFNARNVGPFCSTFNGLVNTQGDAVVVLLAADLQDPPSVVVEFVKQWEAGHEIVYGIRAVRQEGFILRNVRHVYYRTVTKLAHMPIPADVGEFQLIDRQVVDALRQFDDHYPYIRGMIASCGFRSVGVPYTWKARAKGLSKNRIYHLIDQGLNGMISFSRLPMRLCMGFGFGLSILSIMFAMFAFGWHLVNNGSAIPPGVPTLIVAMFFFAGVQLFFFGVIGEYISAIHMQVRKKPLVIERGRLNFGAQPAARLAA
jgi:polyisoprenyl-phosphate glycosyltransferase